MLILLCLCLVALLVVPQTPAPEAPAGQTGRMIIYYLALLKRAPSPPEQSPESVAAIQKAHIAHLEKLGREGYSVAAGPLGGNSEIRGIVILKAESAEHARALQEADPAVAARRLVVEIVPFMAPEGWFGKPQEPFEADHLFFGFLVNGPDRGQDAATAARLQKEHLAYMDMQAQAGRLVLAGPVAVAGGRRRGIIAYRAATFEEALALASGDPMVKSGRLAVELHPWMSAKGVLPLK